MVELPQSLSNATGEDPVAFLFEQICALFEEVRVSKHDILRAGIDPMGVPTKELCILVKSPQVGLDQLEALQIPLYNHGFDWVVLAWEETHVLMLINTVLVTFTFRDSLKIQ